MSMNEPHSTPARAGAQNTVKVVTYHHFASADAAGTRHLGITTHPGRFAAQLDYLAAAYNVVPLDRLISGELPARALLITIDDAYQSVFEIAAPMLAQRRLPAVLFVNPRPVSEAFVPVDHVVGLLGGPRAESVVREAIGEVAGREAAASVPPNPNALSPGLREAVKQHLIAELGTTEPALHRDLRLFLTPDQVRQLPGLGIEVANHTLSHTLCRTLSAGERHNEIAIAKDAIEALTGRPVRAFAFPWGQSGDATPAVLDVVRACGHQATFLMHGLDNETRPAPDIWYRSLVTSETPAGLQIALRLKPRLRRAWRGLPALPKAPSV